MVDLFLFMFLEKPKGLLQSKYITTFWLFNMHLLSLYQSAYYFSSILALFHQLHQIIGCEISFKMLTRFFNFYLQQYWENMWEKNRKQTHSFMREANLDSRYYLVCFQGKQRPAQINSRQKLLFPSGKFLKDHVSSNSNQSLEEEKMHEIL